MFSRWLFVRLNAAEKALRQGRIDDACAAAQQPDLGAHPRGQRLLDDLIRPLISRARLHRQAGRYLEALKDLDQLDAIGRGGPDVQTLRRRIEHEMHQDADYNAEQRDAYNKAADRLRAGRLESVRIDLDQVEDSRKREDLAEDLDRRLARGAQILDQTVEALERGDVLVAIRHWSDTCRRHGRTRAADDVAAKLASSLRQAIADWHTAGRIEQVLAARDGLATLLPCDPSLAESERIVDLCGRAVHLLGSADYTALRQTLLRLKSARGGAPWVDTALDALARVAEGQEVLMASPLGLFASQAGDSAAKQAVHADPSSPEALARTRIVDPDGLRLDRPLLVLVDDGGSSLLVAGDRVRLGRVDTRADIDVPIPGDVQSHHADIIRRGDDYFLAAHGPVRVNNHRRVEHALLHDGDRIVLGSNARMVFRKPSSRSESATLRLSHRCRLPQDVSNVVLFRQTCLVGATPSSHLPTRVADGTVVLFERDGTLHARQTSGTKERCAASRAVVAGQTLEFGELRLTVKPYVRS